MMLKRIFQLYIHLYSVDVALCVVAVDGRVWSYYWAGAKGL